MPGYDFATFGEGWMSRPAQDLCKILIVFGNIDLTDLLKNMGNGRGSTINVRSIESALIRMRSKQQQTNQKEKQTND